MDYAWFEDLNLSWRFALLQHTSSEVTVNGLFPNPKATSRSLFNEKEYKTNLTVVHVTLFPIQYILLRGACRGEMGTGVCLFFTEKKGFGSLGLGITSRITSRMGLGFGQKVGWKMGFIVPSPPLPGPSFNIAFPKKSLSYHVYYQTFLFISLAIWKDRSCFSLSE